MAVDREKLPQFSAMSTAERRQSMPPLPSHDSRPQPRARSNKVLGDYTLAKTLGAGSMGKVKLATHNVSGEKVSPLFFSFHRLTPPSSPSKSSPASTPRRTRPSQTPPQSRPQRTPPRRSARSERPPSPCSSTTPTSAACGR